MWVWLGSYRLSLARSSHSQEMVPVVYLTVAVMKLCCLKVWLGGIWQNVRVVFTELQEALHPPRRVLRAHSLIAMGQHQHNARLTHPFVLPGADKLVYDTLPGEGDK